MFLWLETLVQDVRYGLRVLRRSPGFALTAIFVIALGVGANTAAFTLLDHVLLRPLPFEAPDRLVTLSETQLGNGIPAHADVAAELRRLARHELQLRLDGRLHDRLP